MNTILAITFLGYGCALGISHSSVMEMLLCFLCAGVFSIAACLSEANYRWKKFDEMLKWLKSLKEKNDDGC